MAWARMDFIDRFQVGATETMAISVSQSMCDAFIELSGDDAPLHTDDGFARRNGFEKRLVHGAMVVSLLSRVVGTRFPGPRSLWTKCDISFRNPCYAPSVLRFHGVIVQKSDAARSVVLTFDITDDRERRIATAKTVHKVLDR
jgi:3-hydroxybutyryl-CoA dehydratase